MAAEADPQNPVAIGLTARGCRTYACEPVGLRVSAAQ